MAESSTEAATPELPLDIWRRVAERRPSVARRIACVVPHLGLRELAAAHIQRSWRSGYVCTDNVTAPSRLPTWSRVFFGTRPEEWRVDDFTEGDYPGMQLSPSRRSVHFRDEACLGGFAAFVAFSDIRPLHAARWGIEIVLEEQAQHPDAFQVGVYPAHALFPISDVTGPMEVANLADLEKLSRQYMAKFEPAALEVEPDPSELSLDISQLEVEDEAAFVMRSEVIVDPEQVRPGGGVRSRFRFAICACPDEDDPSHPVAISSQSGSVDPSATVEFSCIMLHKTWREDGAVISPLEKSDPLPCDQGSDFRLAVFGSYDGISVRFFKWGLQVV